jgi:hypothetical protein
MGKDKFNIELFDKICEKLAYSDNGLVKICKEFDINAKSFYDWVSKDEELRNKYARARELQADYLADQIIDIADETHSDTSVNEDGYTIAYFSATLSRLSQRISGTMFVKFRYLGYYNEEIADADFQEFIELIMNHPLFKRITVMAVKDNYANKTYEIWLVKYSGKRFLLPKYTMLTDGKLYDVWYYYFDREENNS